jgi:hypothetical protein
VVNQIWDNDNIFIVIEVSIGSYSFKYPDILLPTTTVTTENLLADIIVIMSGRALCRHRLCFAIERYSAAKERKGITAYNIIVDDFLNAPNIESVDLSTYMGATRNKFHIVATNDFAVKSAHVQISYANDFLIEKNEAVTAKNLWVYTATADNKN